MIPADLQANFIFWKFGRSRLGMKPQQHGGHHGHPSEGFAMRLASLQVRCMGVE